MSFKVSTKAGYHLIKTETAHLTAMLAEGIWLAIKNLPEPINDVIIDLEGVRTIQPEWIEKWIALQSLFYEQSQSMVFCCVGRELESFLDEHNYLGIMNVVNTLSEAIDLIHLERLERDLYNDL